MCPELQIAVNADASTPTQNAQPRCIIRVTQGRVEQKVLLLVGSTTLQFLNSNGSCPYMVYVFHIFQMSPAEGPIHVFVFHCRAREVVR